MQPTPEIEAFIARIEALPPGPGVSIEQALQPSLDEESELRKLFATDRQNKRLSNPYVGLVDVFDAPEAIRTTRARVIQGDKDLSAKYVMPLSETNRRKEGTPCTVAHLDEFKKNWSVFTEGSLSHLIDWNNVVAAGGAVLGCLTPLSEDAKKSKRSIRKYYHSFAYPTSDVDLFLWGLTAEQAEVKINTIYEAIRDSVPWDITCIRTKHTISIHCQYPYRSVQIVLRLYDSPAEILAGFDIDAPCCAYDGNRVWANPRALVAMMRQCNTVDMTRRSPSYEVRLAKYSRRAFEVYVPALKREEIDPTIFERSIARMEGLARLLVLEKLTDTETRHAFLDNRRCLRGRPNPPSLYNKQRKLKGDLKADLVIGGLEMNDYDVQSLHIPYGPGWDARRIDKLVYQTDLGMNSTFNPKNKGRRLHRHPAFFGTMAECLGDCCETCPQPIDDDERTLQKEEDENYIRGRISFIEENPGRQIISGSFRPIDDGEWSEQVYIRPTQRLFAAIAARDKDAVHNLLQEGIDVNHRDHVGRTTLHVAILCQAPEIACNLIDAGARITARLVDGKSPLHLASQYDQVVVVRKLLEKSTQNAEESKDADAMDEDEDDDEEKDEKAAKGSKKAAGQPSSDDDWSSHDDDIEMVDAEDEGSNEDAEGEDEDGDGEGSQLDDDDDDDEDESESRPATPVPETPPGGIPDDDEDKPDVIEVDTLEWDFRFSALSYAILFASLPVLEELLLAGADPKLAIGQSANDNSKRFHPLSLTILREDEDEACRIAERLIQAGASSTTADESMDTIFHTAVRSGRAKLVATMLRCDQHAHSVIDFPLIQYQDIVFPISTAINQQHYSILALMLAHGVKVVLDEEDAVRAIEAIPYSDHNFTFDEDSAKNYLDFAYHPVETAMANHDDVVYLLMHLGANVSIGLKNSMRTYANADERRTLKDWIGNIINILNHRVKRCTRAKTSTAPRNLPEPSGWQKFYREYQESLRSSALLKAAEKEGRDMLESLEKHQDAKAYFVEVKELLNEHGAKTWKQTYKKVKTEAKPTDIDDLPKRSARPSKRYSYAFLTSNFRTTMVPQHSLNSYDELYEACYAGDNKKIQTLCLPAEGAKPGPKLLNISVRVKRSTGDDYSLHGYTPLFAAVAARRWSTAKLILAIAAAQYHPQDDVDKIKFNVDESDNESCNSEDSDITIEKKKDVKFIDIATLSSAIRSDVHPKKLLHQCLVAWRKGERTGRANLLTKAVIDHDLEAFVRVASLYHTLPEAIGMGEAILDTILEEDQPDILDEYIRRTGSGIDMKSNQPKVGGDTEAFIPVNDENKIYLGLNVHGKKRVDLARKNDPDVDHEELIESPMLWKAAKFKSKAIVEYLAGDRPLAAYRFYSSTHSDERAIWLRRATDLDKLLPAWLGWAISNLGDSPFMAAIIGNDLDVIKILFKKSPQIMAAALHQKIKFVGFNALTFAVHLLCDPKLIDYLLSKSISPVERDLIRGWNIYHIICNKNNGDLLEHFLRKLPRDISEILLAQQSKERFKTPLHIAVKLGNIRLVKLIIEFTTSTLLTPDVDGRTVLHTAVQARYPQITSMLLAAADPKGLQMENGVGNTLLDIASIGKFVFRLDRFLEDQRVSMVNLETDDVEPFIRYSETYIQKLEVELPQLHATLDGLLADGKFKRQKKLVTALNKFASTMAERLSDAKVAAATRPARVPKVSEKKDPQESPDAEKTFSIVVAALKDLTITRQLVHLIDVQKSVGADLAKAGNVSSESSTRQQGEDDLDAEQDEDETEKKRSMVWRCIDDITADMDSVSADSDSSHYHSDTYSDSDGSSDSN